LLYTRDHTTVVVLPTYKPSCPTNIAAYAGITPTTVAAIYVAMSDNESERDATETDEEAEKDIEEAARER
jgi:hypothetical protein